MDWDEVDRRAAGRLDPALVRSLRAIHDIAQGPSSFRCAGQRPFEPLRGRWSFLRVALVIAVLRLMLGGLGSMLPIEGAPHLPGGSWAAVAGTFSVTGIWLLLGARSDPRAMYLGGFFLSVASAFAYTPSLDLASLFPPHVASFFGWRGLLAEAFFPVFLWLFVREFPRVLHFSVLERSVERGLVLAVVASTVAFTGSVLAAVLRPDHPEQARFVGWLARDHPSGVLWLLLFGASFPALVMAWYRRRDAPVDERRRATVFIGGIVFGFAPVVLYVFLDLLVPPFSRLMENPAHVAEMRWIVHACLIVMPAVTAYAVRAQHVLDVRLAIDQVARKRLLQFTLVAAAVVPLAALANHLHAHRASSLQQILSTDPSKVLLVLAAASVLLLVVRAPLERWLDRILFRDRPDLQAAHATIVARLRESPTANLIAETLVEELGGRLNVEQINLLALQPGERAYVPVLGRGRPLPADSALAAMATAAPAALILDANASGTTFGLLPESERHWVLDNNVDLILPLCDRAGRMPWIISLGRRTIRWSFTREDRQFVEGLGPAVALALENSAFRRAPAVAAPSEETPAGECTACRRLLAHPDGRCVCGGALTAAPLPLELNGKFRLIKELGRGGMGIVYLAQDLTLRRDVALKTLPNVSARRCARLRNEARSMAALGHAHLASIFGTESWRGTPVLVIEYLSGGTLASRIAGKELSPIEALEICSRIADALGAMHRRGLLHRDVKPSNVGFSSDGTPKLLDFGLAHLLKDGLPLPAFTRRNATSVQRQSGTALYMSPEALAGQSAGPAQDLWSLALVLYECLVGSEQLRIAVEGSRQAGTHDSFPGLDRLLPGHPLGAPLAAFLGRALSRDLHRRLSSARDFGDSLRRLCGPAATPEFETTRPGG